MKYDVTMSWPLVPGSIYESTTVTLSASDAFEAATKAKQIPLVPVGKGTYLNPSSAVMFTVDVARDQSEEG